MGTFSGVGVSADFFVVPGNSLLVTITNTFVATVVIERRISGGYVPLYTITGDQVVALPIDGTFRLSCTDYTSGTVTYAIASQAPANPYLPPGGTTGQELVKTSDASGQAGWSAESASLTGFTGASNTGLGTAAGDSITSATGVTAVGVNAGTAVTTGSANTFVGNGAAPLATTGHDNTAVGAGAAPALVDGSHNTVVGSGALPANTGGNYNTVVGDSAGSAVATFNDSNTLVGASAGPAIHSDGNVGVGRQSLPTLDDGVHNTAVGFQSGQEIVHGAGNALLGYQAGKGQGDVSNTFMVGLGNGQGLIFSIDEMGNLLNIAVRYADGTMKAIAPLALV